MRQNIENKKQYTGDKKMRGGTIPLSLVACIFLLTILLSASGCATPAGVQEERQSATLTSVDITDNKLNIIADRPFTYTIYKPSDPYKVIVDVADARLGMAAGKIKSDKAGITEVILLQTDTPLSSKIEILLSSPAGVVPAFKDSTLTLNIIGLEEDFKPKAEIPKSEEKPQEIKAPAEKVETALKPEEKPSVSKELSPATSIINITFEKDQNTLKLVIKGNGSMNPNVFELNNRIVLDIPNVTLDALLPKAQGPFKGIRSGKYKDKTRIVLDMKEKTSYTVISKADSVIVAFPLPEKEKYAAKAEKPEAVETKTVAAMPEKPAEEGKYKGQKISLDFQDADIGPIFRLLADISGYNFVIDPAVKGKITLKLMNVPWDQALDIILQTFGFAKQEEGNIIWIAPISTFAKINKDRTEAKKEEEGAEELIQDVIHINYATASEISGYIEKSKLLSSRGSVTMDNRMNTLIIKDTQKSINKIKELVKIVDVAKPQVMIEAKIVEVGSTYSESLGIRWGGTLGTAKPRVGFGDVEISSGTFSVNTPVVTAGSSTTNPGGVLGLSLGNANTVQVNLSLSALESVGKSRRLSNPKIMTMDNEAATIQQGVSIPVQTVSAEGTKTEYVNATLSLGVTPKITPDGYVQMKINATNNALGILTPQGYAIETKSVNTQALVKNGETLVIGGIYTTNTSEGEQGIPLLSKIPILGWLFKTKTQTGPNVTELLVFITPTIVTKP